MFRLFLSAVIVNFIFSSTYFVNLSFALTPKEMDAEYEKSEEAKKNFEIVKNLEKQLLEKK